MALFGDGRRSADVVAASPMSLLVVFGTHFREIEAAMPTVATGIRRAIADRLEA